MINEVSASLRPLYNMYINSPSYPDDLFLTSEQALNLADENSMVVVVDTNRPKMVECEELLYLAKTIVVLDHHRQSSDSIDTSFRFSSPCDESYSARSLHSAENLIMDKLLSAMVRYECPVPTTVVLAGTRLC